MEREELITYALKAILTDKWHWFQYHFSFYTQGGEHILAYSIISACQKLEDNKKGLGREFIDRIAALSGREKYLPHYEQLLQLLAELMILAHVVDYDWGEAAEFVHEPTIEGSAKNPELNVIVKEFTLGIEVKAPQFVQHHNLRGTNPQQLPSRSNVIKTIDKSKTTLPRDNPIKDFLISADSKFTEFKRQVPNYVSVLIIVGDDFIYEPISAILSPGSGLFTPNSFAKGDDGNVLTFPALDCIILTRHLLPIVRGTRGEPMPDLSRHPLDYGRPKEFPFKALILNPFVKPEIPKKIIDCFHALKPEAGMGAEYIPSDFIFWT